MRAACMESKTSTSLRTQGTRSWWRAGGRAPRWTRRSSRRRRARDHRPARYRRDHAEITPRCESTEWRACSTNVLNVLALACTRWFTASARNSMHRSTAYRCGGSCCGTCAEICRDERRDIRRDRPRRGAIERRAREPQQQQRQQQQHAQRTWHRPYPTRTAMVSGENWTEVTYGQLGRVTVCSGVPSARPWSE